MDLFGKLKEMTILLIDDDEWIRDSLTLFFEGEGCHLVALETAEGPFATPLLEPYRLARGGTQGHGQGSDSAGETGELRISTEAPRVSGIFPEGQQFLTELLKRQ